MKKVFIISRLRKSIKYKLETGWLKFIAWIGLGILTFIALAAPGNKTLGELFNENRMKDDK